MFLVIGPRNIAAKFLVDTKNEAEEIVASAGEERGWEFIEVSEAEFKSLVWQLAYKELDKVWEEYKQSKTH